MLLKKLTLAAAGAAVGLGIFAAGPAVAQENGQYVPGTVYRTGPYAPGGIPFANGYADYWNLLNERDGGINGVRILYDECDTAYNNDKGVECYEKMKDRGPTGAAGFQPLSTGITYAILDRVRADKIPLITSGLGRADASVGSVFEYVFTLPVTYWAGADAIVQYIQAQEGGDLNGKKIALVYHDSAYGKEPIKTLEYLSQQEGFQLDLFPVPHPGLEQKATWLKIGRQLRPDYVIMWGWGVMNPTAIKEAAAVGFPREKFIGVWWSGSEIDTVPAGDAAKGYKAAQFILPGDYPVLSEIRENVYAKGKGAGEEKYLGEVTYNRGVVAAIFLAEGIRKAQEKFGNKPLTGEEIQWGMENLELTEERLAELGATDMVAPLKLSCDDHEGGGNVIITQWDGQKWVNASDWIVPRRDEYLRKMYEDSAMQYAQEKGITPRDCSKVM